MKKFLTKENTVNSIYSYVCVGLVFGGLFLFGNLHIALAAFGTGSGACTAQDKTAGTSLSCTVATQNFDAGNIAVLLFGADNVSTTDVTTQLLTSVTDSQGNSWTVRHCYTNGQGAAAGGATTCIATSKLTTTLTSGSDTITANFSSVTAKAIVTKEYTVAAGYNIAVAGTTQVLANDALDPASMTIGSLTSGEYLFVRSTALERASGGTWTPTTNFTTTGCNGTSGGTAATNINICGESRIVTTTSQASNPTGTAVDSASVYIAFKEIPPSLSGTVYTDEGSTAASAGLRVKIAVSTTTSPTIYSTTTSSGGAWTYSLTNTTGMTAGTPVAVWVDGNPDLKANLVTRLDGSTYPSDLDLYKDNVILRHEDSGPLTLANLDAHDNSDYSEMLFTASSSAGTLEFEENISMYVWTGDTFAGAATSTTYTGGVTNNGTITTHGATSTFAGTDGVIDGTGTNEFTSIVASSSAFVNDGVTWTARSAAASVGWQDVAYGEGLFVAVGVDSVMTSPDGITWTSRTPGDTNVWEAVTYGGGQFVVVACGTFVICDTSAGGSRVMTSPDGITWTGRTATADNRWKSIVFANGLFVAVSNSGTDRVMTSPDGITWTARSASEANGWIDVTYAEGLFVAVATDGTNRVMTSPDGITWTARAAAEANTWQSVTYGDGLFVAVASDGTNRVMTSPDGITWTARSAVSDAWRDVAYGNGLFVATANSSSQVMTSPDGITWTAETGTEANSWRGLTHANDTFVAVSENGTNRVMTSTSGSYATSTLSLYSNASTTDLYIDDGTTVVAPPALTLFGDYTNNGTFTAGDGTIYEDTGTTADGWHLESASFDSVTFGVTETAPWGMDISDNGLNLYVLGFDTDNIRWYTMATPWDVANASYQGAFSVNSLDNWPNAVSISSDGTKAFFTGDTADGAAELTLGTPYDITTATYVDYLDISAKETSPTGMTFSADGTKMYIAGEASNNIHQYALGTAWDVSTGSFTQSFSLSSQDTVVQGIRFKPDGTAFYMIGMGNDRVYEYSLGTPWDISTASYVQNYSVSGQDFSPTDLEFDEDGTKMFVLGHDGDDISVYTIGTAGSGVVDTEKAFTGNMTGESAFGHMQFLGQSTTTFSSNASTSDFIIGSTALIVAPTLLTVAGDFTNNGTFDANGGTIYLSGASSTLSGTLSDTSALGNVVASSTTYSNDGITWTARSAAAANQWSGVAYGNGTFVAVSWDGTVMSSNDGTTWTSRTGISGSPSWQDIAYGDGLFVAVSSQGTDQVMTSPDGITWTARTEAEANSWKSVIYGEGLFVAVACGIGTGSCDTTAGGSRVMTSPDGITWTGRTATEANGWQEVTYGGGLFVAVSYDGTNRVMTSPDGITWTARAGVSSDWNSVTYGDGLFVAVATNGVMTSPDGITWTSRSAAEANTWRAVTYGNGLFVAVSSDGTNRVMTSPNGITWTTRSASEANQWYSVAYGENTFVAVSNTGTNRVMTSDTGSYSLSVGFEDTSATPYSPGFDYPGKVRVNDLTIGQNTTFNAPYVLAVAGDYSNEGTFNNNDGYLLTEGASGQSLSGDMVGSSALGAFVATAANTVTFTDNASTTDLYILESSTLVAPSVLTIGGDYTNSGTFTKGSGIVYIEGTTTASTTSIASWDITTATYDGAAFSVTAQETQVTSLAFSPDGTRMFIDGYGSDTVYSYTLSTPWDVTTASYDSKSFSTAGQDAFVEKIAFKDDGTKMYALGSGNDRVFQYSLSSAWDVTTASYDSVSALVNQDASPFGLFIKSDGTRMYIAGNTNDRIYSYTLSTPWVMSSATYDNTSFLISGQETAVQDVLFNTDGTEMYIIGYQADTINQYSLSTAWDVTSASFTGSKSITAQETTPDGIEFNDEGSKIYVHGETASDIFPYSLDFSETTTYAGTTTLTGNMTGTSAFNDLSLSTSDVFVADGVTWTARDESENSTWSTIAYGNGTFVALAYSGTNRVMTSPDGITWTSRSASQANSWNSIAYGEGLFVAVAGNGTNQVMTSPDGITWTNRTAAAQNEWYGVTYGDGQFVAIAHNNFAGSATCSTSCVMTSPDGITWTARTAAAANKWEKITYGEGLFVAVASTGTDLVMTSPDGITWTSRNAPGSAWYGLDYGNGTFVAVAYDNVMTSPDGITWTNILTPYDANGWQAVRYGGGLFVAVSPDGTNRIMTSSDNGANWTARSAAAANKWWDLIYGENTFVAVAQQTDAGATCTTSCVMTSTSGVAYLGEIVFANNASTSDLTITADSNITAPTKLSVAGDYTNDGTIEYGTGTTTFNGTTAQTATGTMTGTSAFYNLQILNSTATTSFETALTIDNRLTATGSAIIEFPAGATTTVASFNVVGTSGNEITLRSTQAGTQWGLDATAHNVYYVDVKDSNACSGNGNITATSSTDSGNNLCWTIIAPEGGVPTLSSAANQTFAVGQATTTISTITVTDNASSPSITAASDIRIVIATSTVDMTWDTSDTTAVFGGSASAKVANPVSYEGGGSVLVIPVSTNFSAGDTLTIGGLSFAQFGTLRTPTSGLEIRTGGSADTQADAVDDKTITITGSLVASDHDAGQVESVFSYQNQTAAELFAFKLAPLNENSTVGTLTFNLTGVRRIDSENLSNILLYRDNNADGIVDGGDTAIGGAGALSIDGQTGTITFSSSWSATTTQNYLVIADITNVKTNEYMTMALDVSGAVTGATSLGSITPTGSVSSVQHIRGGNNGGGVSAIGGDAPAGDGIVGGGDQGGGDDIDSNNGDTIGNEPGFEPPAANGTAHNEWTGGGNAYDSDGAYATAASTNLRQSYSVFGFNVPGGNTVQGIEVKLEASGSTGAGTIEVALSWNGDQNVTATKATSVLTTSDAVYTLGGASDTWGRSWTPSEFGDANFFVRVIGQPEGNTVKVDAIQVKPYHQAGGGGGGGGGEI